ncbi:MAG TPA: TetR/AcrR family transcriptional regulator [Roseiflexaceae bacterium]|jgi:AcrR family transcriptional regulator|nr:TetR/AcrR family transcriptional regulator [Roseiflexaceae bacterium]
MPEPLSSDARERVLNAAERLFLARGYAGVSMRDIAEDLGVRQATLYYHVPQGKDQLFLDVLDRNLARHRAGLEAAIRTAGPSLRDQLHAIVHWLVSQPPVDLLRLLRLDRAALPPDDGQRLLDSAHQSLILPIAQVFRGAQERGEIRGVNAMMLAGSLLAMLDWLSFPIEAQYTTPPPRVMADELVDTLLDGLWCNPASPE